MSLPTLIKLAKMRVDEQQQMLAKVQARLDQVEAALVTLRQEKESERATVHNNPEAGMTYAVFVQGQVKREKELEKQRQTAQNAVAIARDKLAEVFAEQKRYELALAAHEEEKRREEQKQEMMEMDEIGSVRFARRRNQKKT